MTAETVERIRRNHDLVLENIERAARRSRRRPDETRLVVVTKLQPVSLVEAAIQAGLQLFGENYADEALPKIQALAHYPGLEWHMIGHIQSRKARLVVGNFALVHSLDSLKLAERLETLLAAEGAASLPLLLEFNLGGEANKSGWGVEGDDLPEIQLDEIKRVLSLPHLQVQGLMTMPPLFADPEMARPYFRRLCRLQSNLARRFPAASWNHLSMGTSADYEIAVEEGATLVRIGQAILGPRPHPMM